MILSVQNLVKEFPLEKNLFAVRAAGMLRALDGVSFGVERGETLGIVGESGSGKSTLARIILRLLAPTSGTVAFDPELIRSFRKDVQLIFQNPYNSLNPRMRIVETLSEPLLIHKLVPARRCAEQAAELLRLVGLQTDALRRRPQEFSGGQRQRICVARALAVQPKFLVLDEPVSSLDLTLQAELLELFAQLKERLGLTYVFISHNLGVIRRIASRALVMRQGAIVEQGEISALFARPQHPYTRSLLEAARG